MSGLCDLLAISATTSQCDASEQWSLTLFLAVEFC
jgi:hypothetical protein